MIKFTIKNGFRALKINIAMLVLGVTLTCLITACDGKHSSVGDIPITTNIINLPKGQKLVHICIRHYGIEYVTTKMSDTDTAKTYNRYNEEMKLIESIHESK